MPRLSSGKPAGAPTHLPRPDIDGIRAIAILSVVLYHAGVISISGGFTGVDIFFVISGYLIGGQIYSELSANTFSYVRFYYRRAKRILPAFYAVLAFTLLAAMIFLSPSEAAELGRTAFYATLSSSNIYLWRTTNYFNPINEFNPLLMTWSLGVEEQFYLVIPLLMVLLVRIRRGLLMSAILGACALSLFFATYELDKHSWFIFYMLPARAWELGLGVALAATELNRRHSTLNGFVAQASSFVGLVLMLAPIFLLTPITPFPGVAALPSVAGTVLVIAAPAGWINQRLLSLSPLVFVGRVSYSFYLWHWPLLSFARILYGWKLSPAVSAIVIAIAFVAAILSYFLIEQPLRASRLAPRRLLFRYAVVSVLFLTACAAVWQSHGVSQRLPELAKAEAAVDARGPEQYKCVLPEEPVFALPNSFSGCYSASDSEPLVAVWGDSHARALAAGIHSVSTSSGYGFIALTRGGCQPLTGASDYSSRDPKDGAGCLRFNQSVMGLLKTSQRIRIVALAGFWEMPFRPSIAGQGDLRIRLKADQAASHDIPTPDSSSELLEESLTATIEGLAKSGKEVIVFGDVPNFDFEPKIRFRTERIPVRRALTVWLGIQDATYGGSAPPNLAPEASIATSAVRRAVSRVPGVAFVDLKSELCTLPRQCPYFVGDNLYYVDNQHLTAYGASYALRNFRLPGYANASN